MFLAYYSLTSSLVGSGIYSLATSTGTGTLADISPSFETSGIVDRSSWL